MSARVAIILPVFNGSAHIRETLLSIYDQTSTDWCLYVIDDHSTDESLEVIDSLPHPQRVVSSNDRNKGLYATLAQAAQSIMEEWVGIVMQDDRPKANWLETALGLADQHPMVEALWANEDIIDALGNRIRNGLNTCRIEIIRPGCEPWYSILRRGCIWQISGSLTKSRLFQTVPFDSSLPHCGDYDWLLRAIKVAAFLYYEYPWIELRKHAGQASAGNLLAGKDVMESYLVLSKNLAAHRVELSLRASLVLSLDRARLVSIRVAAAIIHRRFRLALTLLPFVVRFLVLCTTRRIMPGG